MRASPTAAAGASPKFTPMEYTLRSQRRTCEARRKRFKGYDSTGVEEEAALWLSLNNCPADGSSTRGGQGVDPALLQCCVTSWSQCISLPRSPTTFTHEEIVRRREAALTSARESASAGDVKSAIHNYLQYFNAQPTPEESSASSSVVCSVWKYVGCWQTNTLSSELKTVLAMYDTAEATPDDAKIWDTVGVLFFELGMYAEADLCYTTSLQITPTSAETLYRRGVLLLAVGRSLAALDTLEEANRIGTNSETGRPFIAALFSLATLRLQLNRLDEAIRDFETVLQYDPTNTAALVLIADCLEKQHRFTAATQTLEKARSLDPNDFSIRRATERLAAQLSEESAGFCGCDRHHISRTFDDDRLTTQCPSDIETSIW